MSAPWNCDNVLIRLKIVEKDLVFVVDGTELFFVNIYNM